ncbi:molybdenum cofactor guanylyltransferase [Paraglaciecola marina]|uniref:molybdenum cofactor guanylyltransferase n=1 Tax=Paraglaciecola marina TaxID=2500157 RepID=UPI00105CD729|nr:molybdenum cofactor guanylyltransferase [Paraglaciecola marina]
MLAGLVLAGGQSRRMGLDKSYLRLAHNNLSLLENSQHLLSQVCEPILVSGSQHPQGIVDLYPKLGPMSGIHSGVQYIRLHYPNVRELIVVPIDMPNLSLNELNQLLVRGRESGVLVGFDTFNFPLYIPVVENVLDYLDGLFPHTDSTENVQQKDKQYSIRNFINGLNGQRLAPQATEPFNNINTPQQWQIHCEMKNEK